jgi:hypothetical protein
MARWSGFWDFVYSGGHSLLANSTGNVRRDLGISMSGYGRKPYNRVLAQLAAGNVGGTALGTNTRVSAPIDGLLLGGKRTIETKTFINRVTTAADQAKIAEDLLYKNSPNPWPRDKSGNGGGGKRGY